VTEPVLRIQGISVGFGGNLVVRELSLEVNLGEIVGLIGPNVAGS